MTQTKTATAKFKVGYQTDQSGHRFIVVGAPDVHHADEGGSHNSRQSAIREAKERARRCGGIYVGDYDRARDHGPEHAFDLDGEPR